MWVMHVKGRGPLDRITGNRKPVVPTGDQERPLGGRAAKQPGGSIGISQAKRRPGASVTLGREKLGALDRGETSVV